MKIILLLALLSLAFCYRKHHMHMRSHKKEASSKKGDPVQAAKFALGGYKLHGLENNLISAVFLV